MEGEEISERAAVAAADPHSLLFPLFSSNSLIAEIVGVRILTCLDRIDQL